jgi:hypothetical protein
MPITTTALPYGIRDTGLKALPAPWTTPGTLVDLPYAQTFNWSESEEFNTLRGDDQDIATRGAGPQIEVELENGGLPLEPYKIIAGGATVDTGVTPNMKKTYTKLATDARPYFKIEGQSISDSGGDVHAVVYRCKLTGDIEGEFADGEFHVLGSSGNGFPSAEAAFLGRLYDFVNNETAVPIA